MRKNERRKVANKYIWQYELCWAVKIHDCLLAMKLPICNYSRAQIAKAILTIKKKHFKKCKFRVSVFAPVGTICDDTDL